MGFGGNVDARAFGPERGDAPVLVIVAGAIGVTVYGGALWLLRVNEVRTVWQRL